MIDLDELEARIAEGEKRNFFVAPLVKQLIAELRELRSMRRADNEDITQAYDFARNKGEALERAAVVAWLRAECGSPGHEDRFCAYCNVRRNIAADIERGEHRREKKP
jgi:hypothetical protein